MSEWISPSSSFLCCFEPSLGVKLLMWPHLFLVLYTVAMASEEIIVEGNGDIKTSQVFDMIWSLFGIPIVAVGLWGVYHHIEPHVRYYLYYLIISVLIDMYYVITFSLNSDACKNVQLDSEVSNGKAFACGVASSMTLATTAALFLLAVWAIYIVWSWCEDAEGSAAAWALADLLAMSEGRLPVKRESEWTVHIPNLVGDAVDTGVSVYSGAQIAYNTFKGQSTKFAMEAERIAEYEAEVFDQFAEHQYK